MKTINKFLTVFILLALFLAGTPIQSAHAAGVRYATTSGTGDCSSWANACTLQTALTGASSGDQIWVAAGTYTPHASDRTVSFVLKNGVAIYGGFAGAESLLSERDYAVNLTILSGDLNGDDIGFANKLENSYHAVVGSGTDSTAVLDGVTVTGGKANGSYNENAQNVGGGMYNDSGSPMLKNVTFSRNSAVHGAGLFNDNNSSPTLTNVTFSGNQATHGGGGVYNWVNSNPTLTNVTFSGNLASGGGGMFNNDSSPTLTNVTFSGNSANGAAGIFSTQSSPADTNFTFTFSTNSASDGGGMFNNNSSPTLTNVIIANSLSGGDCVNNASTLNAASSNNLIEDSANACDLTNGVGGNIIGQGPNLGPLTGSPAYFPLLSGSPAIDAGTNTGCPATDQRGVTRPQGAHCDIGAYEVEVETYTITFDSAGGSTVDAITQYYGGAITPPADPTRTGYTFAGWFPALPATMPAEDLTLTAQWTINTYTVTFNANGGSGTMAQQTGDYNTSAALNANTFTHAGYTFSGWNTVANGSGNAYANGAIYAFDADITLYAQWLATPPTFPDVPTDFWAWAFIERLANAGITSGFPDGTFKPAEAVTRGQMAVFLLKGMNFPAAYTPPQATEFNFTDIEGHWAVAWVEALRASGITGGFADGTYRPDAPVTRGQMAIFLLKAINGPDYTPPSADPTFGDTAGHWASDWIEALRASGLTGGYPDGTYRPDNPVTRAEMAVFIVNAFELP